MISGNVYKVNWKLEKGDKVVIVRLQYMIDGVHKPRPNASSEVIFGEFKGFSVIFNSNDIIEKLGQYCNLKRDCPEYLI